MFCGHSILLVLRPPTAQAQVKSRQFNETYFLGRIQPAWRDCEDLRILRVCHRKRPCLDCLLCNIHDLTSIRLFITLWHEVSPNETRTSPFRTTDCYQRSAEKEGRRLITHSGLISEKGIEREQENCIFKAVAARLRPRGHRYSGRDRYERQFH